uniref:Sacchrp_dh_NADP domain-containing protein n=1 Tax=Syphacia muris TaxID=451379 RepID=A0A0N5APF2_9BILA
MPLYDFVLYGVTGYTGIKVLEALVDLPEQKKFAIAGRCEMKIRRIVEEVSLAKGKDLSNIPVIIADTTDELSIVSMVKQAKVLLNVVGPYRIHGEIVVRACAENGTNYVDVSGEPAFLESMQLKYADKAKENNAYIVGCCGFDSLPCDIGVSLLKKWCSGWINHAETFLQVETGDAGYAINSGTFKSLVLSVANWKSDELGKRRRQLMPEMLPRTGFYPPKRSILWYNYDLKSYCLPFLGTDKSVVSRSEYFKKQLYNEYPVCLNRKLDYYIYYLLKWCIKILLQPYVSVKSLLWSVVLLVYFVIFGILTQFEITKRILIAYPERCSFNYFKSSGPTEEQACFYYIFHILRQAKFTYWFYGYGWSQKNTSDDEKPTSPPKRQVFIMVVRCDGPDPAYITTVSCLLCSALTILEEPENLPQRYSLPF